MIVIHLTELKFPIGELVATPNATETFPMETLEACLRRHADGDWGDLCKEDKTSNDRALRDGSRLFSSYEFPPRGKLWIITEADRSATTLLLPEDY